MKKLKVGESIELGCKAQLMIAQYLLKNISVSRYEVVDGKLVKLRPAAKKRKK